MLTIANRELIRAAKETGGQAASYTRLLTQIENRLSIQQTGVVVAVALGMLMLPLAPLNGRFSGACVVLFIFIAFGTRNIAAIGLTVAIFSLLTRLFVQISSWHDQHWIQWSSISALLTGHNMFDTSPLYNFSLSSYMPSGDLFGGLFIALGIDRYWQVWHVLVVCLVGLPLLLSPSFVSLLMFIVLTAFYPFCDYTTGGGTLEIAYALSIGAIAMFRTPGLLTPSLVLFAFTAMFRQPSVVTLPFIFLILWRRNDLRRIKMLAVMLVLFGGIYIAANPAGAYHYLYKVWDMYHQNLFNVSPGMTSNYSIASIPHAFGISDSLNWYGWRPYYNIVTILGLAGLFWVAWFRKNPEETLFMGFLAASAVYVLSRGYAQFGYTATAFFPFVAFAYPIGTRQPLFAKRAAGGFAVLFLWMGSVPPVLYATALAIRKLGDLSPPRVVHAVKVSELQSSSRVVPIASIDGTEANVHVFPLSSAVEFELPAVNRVVGIRLTCNHVPVQDIKGVLMPYPTDLQMRGAIEKGVLKTSEDGISYAAVRTFNNSATYCLWPVTIPLPSTAGPVSFVRLKAEKLFLDQQEWTLGDVEFLVK